MPTFPGPEKRPCCAEQTDEQEDEAGEPAGHPDTQVHSEAAQILGHPGHAGLSGVLREVLAKGAFDYMLLVRSGIFPFSSSSSQCF